MKYKAKRNLLEELKAIPYFNKDRILILGKNEKTYNLTDSTINTYISRSLKSKDIISLKNGLYISATFYHKNKSNIAYLYFLANIIRGPSYISSWTALQYYNLTTEIIYTITSVTPKVTRDYKTKVGTFSYQSIKKDLFSDFSFVKDEFYFFIASPSKALFDLLYFRTQQFKGLKLKDINLFIEELRINIDEMEKKEQKKFYSMIKKYIKYE